MPDDAGVIQLKSLGDRADDYRVGVGVGTVEHLLHTQGAIAVSVERPLPQPTAGIRVDDNCLQEPVA
jgi:hypothetical protein